MFERKLAILNGRGDGERTSVVEVSYARTRDADCTDYVELRFERRVGDAGWVVQRRIPISSADVADLRLALTLFSSAEGRSQAPKVVSLDDYRDIRTA